MYPCGVLLLTLVAVALGVPGVPPRQANEDARPADNDQKSALELSDLCFDGSPSFLCYLRCGKQGFKSACDNMEGCVCVPLDSPIGENWDLPLGATEQPKIPITTEAPETTDGGKLHIMFYIYDWADLFGGSQGTTTTEVTPDEATATGSSVSAVQNVITSEEPEPGALKGWISAHIMAVVIVALLCVLILVELFACLKKQNIKHKEANMFNSLGVTNKS